MEAPHLLEPLRQQQEKQPAQLIGPAPVDLRTARGFFRAWRESQEPYNYGKEVKEADTWERSVERGLKGCSLVLNFFCRSEDKEAMAQVTVPCDDEEKMSNLFPYKYDQFYNPAQCLLQQNLRYKVKGTYLDRKHMWRDPDDDGLFATLEGTRVLAYMVDGQRGRILHIFDGTCGEDFLDMDRPSAWYWDERRRGYGNEVLKRGNEAVYIGAMIDFSWDKKEGVRPDRPEMKAALLLHKGSSYRYNDGVPIRDIEDVKATMCRLLELSARSFRIKWG